MLKLIEGLGFFIFYFYHISNTNMSKLHTLELFANMSSSDILFKQRGHEALYFFLKTTNIFSL